MEDNFKETVAEEPPIPVRATSTLEYDINFRTRHVAEPIYDPLPSTEVRYFSEEYNRIIENITEIGKVTLTASSIPEIPVDDTKARESRVGVLEKKAAARLYSTDGFDEIKHAVLDDEEVVLTFDCTEATDFPSSTVPVSIRGPSKVFLVKSKEDSYRLFFSITEGCMEISARELYHAGETKPGCVCCFLDCLMPCSKPLTHATSEKDVEYSTTKYMTTQFFTYPISGGFVDAVTYRASDNEYTASTLHPPGEDRHRNCCDYLDCTFLACCVCGETCKDTPCCAWKRFNYFKSVEYHGYERIRMGEDAKKYDPVVEQPSNDKQWNLNIINEDHVYIVLHYRSLLDNGYHSCRLRLRRTDTPQEDFKIAQRFVSVLGSQRNKIVQDHEYFRGRPGMIYDSIRSNRPRWRPHVTEENAPTSALYIASCMSATCFICWDKSQALNYVMQTYDFIDRYNVINNLPLWYSYANSCMKNCYCCCCGSQSSMF